MLWMKIALALEGLRGVLFPAMLVVRRALLFNTGPISSACTRISLVQAVASFKSS